MLLLGNLLVLLFLQQLEFGFIPVLSRPPASSKKG